MSNGKKVSFGIRPTPKVELPATADQWVESRAVEEPTKRFTIEVRESLHSRIKAQCALRGEKMADVIRELLDREFPKS